MSKILKKPKKFTVLLIAAVFLLNAAPGAYASERMLTPIGCTVGIQMNTEGVLVVGLSDIDTEDGSRSPAKDAGVLPGDIIVSLNGNDVKNAADFMGIASELSNGEVPMTVKRGGRTVQMTLKPVQGVDGKFHIGLWLRDSITGIGTVTFMDPVTGMYGALGHPINDSDTGIILPIGNGSILESTVVDIKKGLSGAPGELSGVFDESKCRGSIIMNTECGIFGYICENDPLRCEGDGPIPVAEESEIKLGSATVLANIKGKEVEEYSIEISRVYRNEMSGRSLMFTVTDQQLLGATGGIVQGMSGSPIIQNGKLIGAVTHVLVNDPARGYGVSAEKMLELTYCAEMDKAA